MSHVLAQPRSFISLVQIAIGWLFYLQALYYSLRAFRSISVTIQQWLADRRIPRNISKDPENDLGHMTCMLVMGHHLAPIANLHESVTASILLLGWIWFTLRTVTWGLNIPGNKPWWDATHSGIFIGMYLMDKPLPGQWILIGAQILFWSWFTVLYINEIRGEDNWNDRISDLCHADMGLVMLVMTIIPSIVMAHDQAQIADRLPPHMVATDDTALRATILDRNGSSVVMVFGGCESCVKGAKIFDQIAKDLCSSNTRFIKINKDKSPALCRELGVEKCPVIIVVHKGEPAPERLEDIEDAQQLISFIIRQQGQ